jgi:hypothetical protein
MALRSLYSALLKPLPRWTHRLIAMPGMGMALIYGLALLGVVLYMFFGAAGMATRFGLGLLAVYLLLECILSGWFALDVWREGDKHHG